MIALPSLLVLSTLAAGGDAALLQFTSGACPACKTVEPVVQRLTGEGYNVQTIDVAARPEVAQQFQVRAVPTFVVVSGGKVTGQLEGACTYDRLVQLAQTGGLAPRGVQNTDFRAATLPNSAPQQTAEYKAPPSAAATPPVAAPPLAGTGSDGLSPMHRAMYASVRLKVEDASGFGYGTGTVIDRHEDEALVITCGHLFRESQGKGKITVDLFAPGAKGPVEGQLISYDLDRDIALVSIRPGVDLPAVRVGGGDYGVKPHDPAFSIGCDKGADASIRETKITSVNKYTNPLICAAGAPIDGRSGGGLFSAEGVLIGVCNAADPKDDEGLYASLKTIQWQLDQIGQSEIYRRGSQPAPQFVGMGETTAPANRLAPEANSLPSLPKQMPLQTAEIRPTNQLAPAFGNSAAPSASDVEVIMIVRSKSNPQGQSQIMVLDNASPQLIQQLATGARPAGVSGAELRTAANTMVDAGRSALGNPLMGAVVRGQGE